MSPRCRDVPFPPLDALSLGATGGGAAIGGWGLDAGVDGRTIVLVGRGLGAGLGVAEPNNIAPTLLMLSLAAACWTVCKTCVILGLCLTCKHWTDHSKAQPNWTAWRAHEMLLNT
jgi:hypothetical protein